MRVVIAAKWLATEILAACIARSYDILLAVTNRLAALLRRRQGRVLP